MDDDLLREVASRECLPDRSPLRFARRAGDAHAEHLRNDMAHPARGERVGERRGDDVGRMFRLAGAHRATGADNLAELRAMFIGHDDAGLRAASVDSEDNEGHVDTARTAGTRWVKEEMMPTTSVMVVPMRTYQGHAMFFTGASVDASDG